MDLAEDLLADGDPEREYDPGIAARMPRKRVAAGALIRDRFDRVLLVEPSYKPGWELPGGVVEADESPLQGCRRELREELDLELGATRLLVVDWVPRRGPWHDAVLFLFDGGVLPDARLAAVRPAHSELRAVHLATLEQAAAHLRPSAVRRLSAALDAARSGTGPFYLEFGRLGQPRSSSTLPG